jgi:predicted nuclease of predicted toxin-antitoxin system
VTLLPAKMLSPAIARQLRSRGHDVEPVAGNPDREALSDPEVLALARAGHRAIVTNNLRDFRPLHYEAVTPGGPGHFGMIFMPSSYRRTKADTGRIIAALEAILAQYPGEKDLANGEAWL